MLRVRYCDSTSFMLPQCNTVGNYLQKKLFYFVMNLEVPVKDQVLSLFGPPMRKHNVASAVEQKQSPAKSRSYIRTEDKSRSPNLIMSTTQVTWIPRPYLLKVPPPFNIKHMDLCGHYPHPNPNIAHPLLCNSPAWESLLQISLGYASLIKPKNRSGGSIWDFQIKDAHPVKIFRNIPKLLASTVYPAFQIRDTQSACFKL